MTPVGSPACAHAARHRYPRPTPSTTTQRAAISSLPAPPFHVASTSSPAPPPRTQIAGFTFLAIGYGLAAAFVVVAVANTASHGLGHDLELCYGVPPCIPAPDMMPPLAMPPAPDKVTAAHASFLSFRHALAHGLGTESAAGESALRQNQPWPHSAGVWMPPPLSFRHALAHGLAGEGGVAEPSAASLRSHHPLTPDQPWPHAAGDWLSALSAPPLSFRHALAHALGEDMEPAATALRSRQHPTPDQPLPTPHIAGGGLSPPSISFRHALAHGLTMGEPATAALHHRHPLAPDQPLTAPNAAGGWLHAASALLRRLSGRAPSGQPDDPPQKQNPKQNSPLRGSPQRMAGGQGDVRSSLGLGWFSSDGTPGLDAMCGLETVC